MKLFAVLLATLALAAGFAGGLRAYSAAAPAPAPKVQVSAPHYPKAQPVKPGATFRWAPCQKPAVRQGKACVTTVTRTVTLSQPAAPAAPVAQSVPVTHAAPVRHAAPATHQTAQPTYHDGGGGHDDGGGGGHDD